MYAVTENMFYSAQLQRLCFTVGPRHNWNYTFPITLSNYDK